MEPVTLRTERLVLDLPGAQLGDAARILEYCNDPLFEKVLTTPWPYTADDAAVFLERFVPGGWEKGVELTWAIRHADDDALLGLVGSRTPTGMIGYWMGAPHRGRGFMREAVAAVIDWRFAQGEDLVRWEAIVGNAASAAVARSLGFTYTGVAPAITRWRDGTHPDSWHAQLRPGDAREPQEGWPL